MNIIIKNISLIIILIFTLTLIPAGNVSAADGDNIASQMTDALKGFTALPGGNDDGNTRLEIVIGTLIQTFLSLFGIIFLALMVYGGYKWMMAKGNDEDVTKAKAIIRSAIIGLAIVLLAYAITLFIVTYFNTASNTK